MDSDSTNNTDIVAPCGLNCGLCRSYLRKRNKCHGCRLGGPEKKSKTFLNCRIKNCQKIQQGLDYCINCDDYPCENINHLEKRYTTRYSVSVKENMAFIQTSGIEEFLAKEKKKWTCSICGGTISMHKGHCTNCS